MTIRDWPGRRRAESLRQWPALEDLARWVAERDVFDGLILLGSFAEGNPDELSDIDALAVVAPGRFEEAWDERHRLAPNALVTWESRSDPNADIGWLKWLTRDLVKVECGIVDPDSGAKGLAEPIVVAVGDQSVGDRFARISVDELEERRRKQQAEQVVPADDSELPYGELIDWKLSELKKAVRRSLRETSRGRS